MFNIYVGLKQLFYYLQKQILILSIFKFNL